MSKPTVYVDTNIFSYLHYIGADETILDFQTVTREWWKNELPHFMLLVSRSVEWELAASEYLRQAKALAELRKLPFLAYGAAVQAVKEKLLATHVIPESVPGDAIQLAFAIEYRVDYLLSWNRAHLVSVETEAKLARFRAATGLRTPLVVSPRNIPKVALGEAIRRRD